MKVRNALEITQWPICMDIGYGKVSDSTNQLAGRDLTQKVILDCIIHVAIPETNGAFVNVYVIRNSVVIRLWTIPQAGLNG